MSCVAVVLDHEPLADEQHAAAHQGNQSQCSRLRNNRGFASVEGRSHIACAAAGYDLAKANPVVNVSSYVAEHS